MSSLVWLITGCSSGFGEQFVRSILARGDKIIATSRKLEKLKHLEQAGAAVLQLDVTDSQENLRNTIAKAISIYGRVDVLVNNAAYIAIGTWEDLEYEDFLAQFETNVFGTIKVTRALLPHLRDRRTGTIVCIGSRSGWSGDPGVGAYSGTKFALEGIVESLWRETTPLGIKTLLIEPGRFRTKLLSAENLKATVSAIPDYADMSRTLMGHLASEDQAQQGDPVKHVEIVLDLVRQEGVACDKAIPFRLPLGVDSFDDIKAKCEETLELLKEWEAVIRSTNYEDKNQ
ncbi:NAD(P)-binding protein [Rhizodiscina lignyota]|uniref:NAD(P)-binding protein n=1 Tax=Rhizodiscina lignyota TaxID=1504668 RepID=A0A9P4I1J6_9PEZI|nr:NAD(P)-binding protein [Rhizodiscina lignyota]